MSAPLLHTGSKVDPTDRGTIERDSRRLFAELRGELARMYGRFRERLFRDNKTITARTARPGLMFGEMAVVDTRAGDVALYLPRASRQDAGRVLGFCKKYQNNAVNLIATNAAINTLYSRMDTLTQLGIHYICWDGDGWVMQEPAARVRRHDDRLRPLALWQFTTDSLLTDEMGSYDLTVETGTERYTRLDAHTHGFYFDGATSLYHSAAAAALRLTGDMTFMCLWNSHTGVSGARLISHGAATEVEADNNLYSFGYDTYPSTVFLSESGAGVNATHSVATLLSIPGQLVHVAVVRASGVVSIYHNTRILGDPSAALATPTGGASGRLRLGASTTPTYANGAMASAMLINRAVSIGEIRAAYNRTMGMAHGFCQEN